MKPAARDNAIKRIDIPMIPPNSIENKVELVPRIIAKNPQCRKPG
jgi:hypothetical protein